jgi:hypothetical protein
MSEWIDFLVYAAQAVALWILMPRWGARMALPVLRARNAAWVDAHPDALTCAKPGAWFLKACYVWAAISVAVLLVFVLDLQPQPLLPDALATPRWRVLMSTNTLLMFLGLFGYFSGGAVFMRWVARTVPQSERRQATLRPRTTEDFVPRWLRLLVYAAVGAHMLAWMYAGVSGLFSDPRYWWAFAVILGMTVLMFVLGQFTVLRRPSWMDAGQGLEYRRVEVRVMYAVQLCLVGFGAVALAKLLLDLDLQRACTLGFGLFFTATMLVMTRTKATTHNLLTISRGEQPM